SFMHSVPNYTPMRPSDVRRMRALLAPYDYDDVYGFSWGRNIIGNDKAAVEASFDRVLLQLAAYPWPLPAVRAFGALNAAQGSSRSAGGISWMLSNQRLSPAATGASR